MLNSPAVTAAALIMALVAGIVVWQLTDETPLVVMYTALVVIGIYFLICVPFAGNEGGFGPSQSSFRLVWGVLLTTIGALMLISVYSALDTWIIAVILLAVIAVLILIVFTRNTKRLY
jgi:uncharacterized membrane protein